MMHGSRDLSELLKKMINAGRLQECICSIDERLSRNAPSQNEIAVLSIIKSQLLKNIGNKNLALMSLRKACKLNKVKPEILMIALFEGAREAFELKYYDESVKLLTRCLSLVHAKFRLHSSKSATEDDLNWTQTAFSPDFDPDATEAELVGRILLLRANALTREHKLSLAIEDLSKIIEFPDMSPILIAAALLDRGVAWHESGAWILSQNDLIAVTKIYNVPERYKLDAFYNLTIMHAGEGRIKEAAEFAGLFYRSPGSTPEKRERLFTELTSILDESERLELEYCLARLSIE